MFDGFYMLAGGVGLTMVVPVDYSDRFYAKEVGSRKIN